ncbi:uncharacterized protein LOC114539807 [Dendronephthya gigantea]|uniref:uncharacterized protein LOC114539807 n=1 Tax=Dendronephthya gigantea TaxID=151771 RepID=UPI00106D9A9C|nr:uncharacterized protein LOC114539807 [Dendronephthya gigantea]
MSSEKQIRIRGGHRAYVSKLIESVNGIIEHFSGSTSEREKLESLKVTLKDKKEILKSIDEAILESTKDEGINKEILEASDIETLGIRDNEPTTESKFMEDISFNGNQYEVKLPFREEHPLLPDNHVGSVKRLNSLLTRLKANPNLLQEYDNIIKDQIKSGVVEPADDVLVPVGKVHYLPHREVVREDKNTTKKRAKNLDTTLGLITCEEIDNAELKWIKDIQYPMTKQANYEKVKKSLNLFKDKNDIVRCHGRIQESPLPYDTKYPILLPSDHYFTRLVVLRSHEQLIHNGVRETLTQVRSKFWITKCRQVVKKILSKCVICRRLEGPPYGNPEAPPLPEFRLSNELAFSKIGVDYAGPMYVKDMYSQSKDMHKVYISLYTCASSRALHLDLVPDMTSEAFVRSLERFIGRRGIPALIISDNGKTFKGKEIKNFIASRGIKWRYIVEKSPWWGGFYERMVRSVKRCLKKVLRNARLTYEELLTLLIRVEGVLNSRPLTYVYSDEDEPLTPSHLVLGKRILTVPTQVEIDANDEGKNELLKREKYLKNVLKHFWKRWKLEYLTQLREQHQPSKKDGPKIKVGDVVLIQEDNVKRLNWPIAVIESLLKGRDGNARAATVRMFNKAGKLATTRRAVQRLYPVEVNDSEREVTAEFPITFVERAKSENTD